MTKKLELEIKLEVENSAVASKIIEDLIVKGKHTLKVLNLKEVDPDPKDNSKYDARSYS